MVREDPSKEMTFRLQPEWQESAFAKTWRKSCPDGRDRKCKGPEAVTDKVILSNRMEATMVKESYLK